MKNINNFSFTKINKGLLVFITIIIAQTVHASVVGEVIKKTVNPFPDYFGFGLANDGEYLYVGGASDGTIHVLEPDDLSVVRTISTPAPYILGIEYYNGSLYVSDSKRIYQVDTLTNNVTSFFDAPNDSVVGLSVGPDGRLYAMDGYEGSSWSKSYIYSFNITDNTLNDTFEIGTLNQDLEIDYSGGNDIIEFIGGYLVTDDDLSPSDLSVYSLHGNTYIKEADFPIETINGDWRGSTIIEETLYLWGQNTGSGYENALFEIQIIPEPSTLCLLGFAAGVMRIKRSFSRGMLKKCSKPISKNMCYGSAERHYI